MDGSTPLVSVIMSVRNGEQWLNQAIDSIVHQSYSHWEFIIVDDASGEAAKRILQQYQNDPRIILIRQETQQGLTKNLNIAIDRAKGEYIARMDADDISLPDRIQKQVGWLKENPGTSAVAGWIEFIDENGSRKGEWADDRNANTWQEIRSALPHKNCIAHPTVMIRASVLKEFRYNEAQLHSQDWDLWLRMADAGKIIDKIKEPVLLYRVHSTSITSQTNKKSAFQKKHEFYLRYLDGSRNSEFNNKVRASFRLNRIKLFLSSIKRRLTS